MPGFKSVEVTNSIVVEVLTPAPHSSSFVPPAGVAHSTVPPRRSVAPNTLTDIPTVLVSTGLLNVTLIVPPQKPTGFPLESTVGHSDRRTPTAPLTGLIEAIANGPGLGLGPR